MFYKKKSWKDYLKNCVKIKPWDPTQLGTQHIPQKYPLYMVIFLTTFENTVFGKLVVLVSKLQTIYPD